MVQRRSMTDVEREDALAVCRFWGKGMRINPVKTCVESFLIGGFGIGALTAGAVFLILSWFIESSLLIEGSVVIGASLLGGIGCGLSGYRWAIENNRASVKVDREIRAMIDLDEVWVYSSASVDSHFDDDENPEHPPLIVDFGHGDILTIESMEQDEFQINDEINGECEIVTLPQERSPILSVRTAESIRRSSLATDSIYRE